MQCVERKERHAEYSKTRFGYEYVEVDIFFLCVLSAFRSLPPFRQRIGRRRRASSLLWWLESPAPMSFTFKAGLSQIFRQRVIFNRIGAATGHFWSSAEALLFQIPFIGIHLTSTIDDFDGGSMATTDERRRRRTDRQ